MRKTARNLGLLGTVLVAATFIAIPADSEPAPICLAAQEWVEQHRADLPATLDALVRFPIVYRRAIYAALPVEVRSRLWQDHWDQFIQDNELTDSQQELLIRVRDNVDRYLAMEPGDPELVRFEDEVRRTLGDELGRGAVAVLGPTPVGVENEGLQTPDCACSIGSDWCGSGHECLLGSNCNYQDWGCGTFGIYACDGLCGHPE